MTPLHRLKIPPPTRLKVPGGITLGGVRIDLRKIRIPGYFVSTLEDHIAPWKSTYKGARILSGPKRFVLGGSGHIAGIVNPPSAKKYGYRTWSQPPEAAEEWQAGADLAASSWGDG